MRPEQLEPTKDLVRNVLSSTPATSLIRLSEWVEL